MHHDEDCDVWLTYAVDVRTPSNSASRTISPLLTLMPIISKTTSKGKQGFPPDRISTATSLSVFCGLVLCRNHPFSLSPTITLIFKISSAAMLSSCEGDRNNIPAKWRYLICKWRNTSSSTVLQPTKHANDVAIHINSRAKWPVFESVLIG